MRTNKKTGFTLIELSIVIVIIGLVIGGIMVGNDLIKAAQRRAQIAQFEMFQLAISTFKLKYGKLAGDADNATDFFAGVTNGNGNGILQLADASTSYTAGTYGGEVEQFFIHLSKANLLDGNYTGGSTINVGYPSSKIKSGTGMIAGSSVNNRQVIRLFIRIINPTSMPNLNSADDVTITSSGRVLSGEETMYLDVKADDGNPSKGRFVADTESAFPGPSFTPCNDGTNYYWNVSTSRCRPSFDLKY
jgi:prepilin-type N-terminal cleavage/methylation domain-containing protein